MRASSLTLGARLRYLAKRSPVLLQGCRRPVPGEPQRCTLTTSTWPSEQRRFQRGAPGGIADNDDDVALLGRDAEVADGGGDEDLWDSIDDDEADDAAAAADSEGGAAPSRASAESRLLDELVDDANVDLEAPADGNAPVVAPAARRPSPDAAAASSTEEAPKPRRRVSLKPVPSLVKKQKPPVSAVSPAVGTPPEGAMDPVDAALADELTAVIERMLETAASNPAVSARSRMPISLPTAEEAHRLREGGEEDATTTPAERPSVHEVVVADLRNETPADLKERIRQRLGGGGLLRWLKSVPTRFDVAGDASTVAVAGKMPLSRRTKRAAFVPRQPSEAAKEEWKEVASAWYIDLGIDGPADDDGAALSPDESRKAFEDEEADIRRVREEQQGFMGFDVPAAPSVAAATAPGSGGGLGFATDRIPLAPPPKLVLKPPKGSSMVQSAAEMAAAQRSPIPPPVAPPGHRVAVTPAAARRTPPALKTTSGMPDIHTSSVIKNAATSGRTTISPMLRAPTEMLEYFIEIVPTFFVPIEFIKPTRRFVDDILGGSHASLSLPRLMKKYQFFFELRRGGTSGVSVDVRLRDSVQHAKRGEADALYDWVKASRSPDGTIVVSGLTGSSKDTLGFAKKGGESRTLAQYMSAHPLGKEGLGPPPILNVAGLAPNNSDGGSSASPLKWGPHVTRRDGSSSADRQQQQPPAKLSGDKATASSATTFFAPATTELLVALPMPAVKAHEGNSTSDGATEAAAVPFATWTCTTLAEQPERLRGVSVLQQVIEASATTDEVAKRILELVTDRDDVFLFLGENGLPPAGGVTVDSPFMLRPLSVSPGACGAYGADNSPCKAAIDGLGYAVPRGVWVTEERVQAKLKPDAVKAIEATQQSIVDIARAHGRILWVDMQSKPPKLRRFAGDPELDDVVHFALVLVRDVVSRHRAANPDATDLTARDVLEELPAAVRAMLRVEGNVVLRAMASKQRGVFIVKPAEAPAGLAADPSAAAATAAAADGFDTWTIGRASVFRK